jgi:hypothetical protein
MGVRLYNATTERFLSVDPVRGGNANPYDYCNGDPVNCFDLDGKIALGQVARLVGGCGGWVVGHAAG